MPTIARLPGNFRICLYLNDHDPPHFHVEAAVTRAQIRIADLQVIRGFIRRSDLLSIENWARRHQAELALNWVFARAKLDLREIPYP
ncbi:MAG: DUF4160 domain-containing protein [Acetobacteraceae bacterium]|nr:DUF4160 domain-containing protein [Acetobacteraceae bacterium]